MRLGARPAERASGPWSDLPGGQPGAASPRPPRRPRLHSKRMNQRRPGARPPRFLFSFSTPRAAGAARLHRRSFPGTLPLAPLSALGVPGPSSSLYYKKIPNCQRRPGRPRLVLPCSLCPGRPAASPWFTPSSPEPLARKPSRTGAGASECDYRAAAGLGAESGRKPGVERLPPGVARARGSGGTWRARAAAHLPRGDPKRPAETPNAPRIRCASRSPGLPEPRRIHHQPNGQHKHGLFRSCATVF